MVMFVPCAIIISWKLPKSQLENCRGKNWKKGQQGHFCKLFPSDPCMDYLPIHDDFGEKWQTNGHVFTRGKWHPMGARIQPADSRWCEATECVAPHWRRWISPNSWCYLLKPTVFPGGWKTFSWFFVKTCWSWNIQVVNILLRLMMAYDGWWKSMYK